MDKDLIIPEVEAILEKDRLSNTSWIAIVNLISKKVSVVNLGDFEKDQQMLLLRKHILEGKPCKKYLVLGAWRILDSANYMKERTEKLIIETLKEKRMKSFKFIDKGETVDILRVPIFKLGMHKGYNFDEAWARETFKYHDLRDPVKVITGHTSEEDQFSENPQVGFMKNYQLKDDIIYVDVADIDKQFFEESLKTNAYPNRSIEIDEIHDNRFTALSLISSTPFHKLPVMCQFHESPTEVISFAELTHKSEQIITEFDEMPDVDQTSLMFHKRALALMDMDNTLDYETAVYDALTFYDDEEY